MGSFQSATKHRPKEYSLQQPLTWVKGIRWESGGNMNDGTKPAVYSAFHQAWNQVSSKVWRKKLGSGPGNTRVGLPTLPLHYCVSMDK